MSGIRSFLYVDHYKLYSAAAQVDGFDPAPAPGGADGANRRIGDERAYSLFEARLAELGTLATDPAKIVANLTAGFVKVTGTAMLLDLERVVSTIGQFNRVGEAITYVSGLQDREQKRAELEGQIRETPNRARKDELKQQIRQLEDIGHAAAAAGLQKDERFLSEVNYIIDYGFGTHVEIRVHLPRPDGPPLVASAILAPECLREPRQNLGRKFGTIAQQPFSVVGIVTRSPNTPTPTTQQLLGAPENLKELTLSLAMGLSAVQEHFAGHELVIDPIAVYREL